MLKILLLVLIASAVTYAEIKKFTDFSARNLNGQNVSFEKYKNKCVLVVNTGSHKHPRYFKDNFKYLGSLTNQYPSLEIVAFPTKSSSGVTNQSLRNFFFTVLEAAYDVMELTEIENNEIYNFLELKSNQGTNQERFVKYVVEKDGETVTKYDTNEGCYFRYELNYHLEKCTEEEIDNFTDYTGVNILDKYELFMKYTDQCVLVVYLDINFGEYFEEFKPEPKYVQDLKNLKQLRPLLDVVVFPTNNFRADFSSNYIYNLRVMFKFNWGVNFDVMAPIREPIQNSMIYKFLIKNSYNIEIEQNPSFFLVERDGLTVSVYEKSENIIENIHNDRKLKKCLHSLINLNDPVIETN